ncbi:MAG: peptidyl-tRNA hydrolase [Candidatus Diapherotrites archaeon]|uniref:Peptidyl-tRNA hydrolase n=1 Tax=Candidatus Iainarchaeum sp. TaxID=3101447 RepID=A0A8T3YLA7_9ARCH|nr:peptidyl-tRNA hydrolase [Candidatus Diapherotrites archaeon]
MQFKQAIVVRSDLKMGKGKIAAQCSHASLDAYEKSLRVNPRWVEEWKATGTAKVVLKAGSEKELLEIFEKAKKALPTALVKDAGRTQLESGTITCIAIGPAPESEIDGFTKHLKLL